MSKVLIVEDDQAILNSYAFVLTKKGYQVLQATRALDGLRLAAKERPEVILLDMLMPEGSGLDFLRQLDPAKNLPDTKIIVLSNTESPKITEEALHLGALKYLLKVEQTPYTVADAVMMALGGPQ